jgi:hypothetical protein
MVKRRDDRASFSDVDRPLSPCRGGRLDTLDQHAGQQAIDLSGRRVVEHGKMARHRSDIAARDRARESRRKWRRDRTRGRRQQEPRERLASHIAVDANPHKLIDAELKQAGCEVAGDDGGGVVASAIAITHPRRDQTQTTGQRFKDGFVVIAVGIAAAQAAVGNGRDTVEGREGMKDPSPLVPAKHLPTEAPRDVDNEWQLARRCVRVDGGGDGGDGVIRDRYHHDVDVVEDDPTARCHVVNGHAGPPQRRHERPSGAATTHNDDARPTRRSRHQQSSGRASSAN